MSGVKTTSRWLTSRGSVSVWLFWLMVLTPSAVGCGRPPVALSEASKKSSRKMSLGNSRLRIRVFSAASTIGGGPQR